MSSTNSHITKTTLISIDEIHRAQERIKDVAIETPFLEHFNLSKKYSSTILLKREDMQVVRSFKIRGAFNKIMTLSENERASGIICASAGNHAQGVALACNRLKIKGSIYMPNPTPAQKLKKVRHFGGDFVNVILEGDTYDDAYQAALNEAKNTKAIFIHPFEDLDIMAGQGTIAAEMISQSNSKMDYLLVAVGGGGLLSGVGSYFKQVSPETRIIAVEASGAAAFSESLKSGKKIRLNDIDTFADGIAVKELGDLTFNICQTIADESITVPEGKICSTILDLYNEDAIVVEPAGAISIAALDQIKEEIIGKTVGIIICGGNNDISRTQEIAERSLLYEGKKHYFMIRFPQRAGALREFLNILGPEDDITHFEYMKKTNKLSGPAVVGIEFKNSNDYLPLILKMKEKEINFQHVNYNPSLFELLV